jgi:AAA domain/UvrD-like helicase C-terminal domain
MNAVSDEQQNIITHVENGKNVQVDACAGSGKSTTILSAAKAMPKKNFLLITYNKSLRKEMKEKIEELDLKNITVHTYHSLAVAVYNQDAHVDKVMRLLISRNDPLKVLQKGYDIVVLDEVQDMTFLYYRLIIKYIKDVGEKIQLMVLGDYMQGLYEFKGADIRFLTFATEIWNPFLFLRTIHFEKCQLKTSYRITNQMADFVNETMLQEKRLYACREGEPVCYIRRRIHELQWIVVNTIQDLISNHGVKPSDIFVLGGSVKGPNSNIRKIENALVEAGIPCHVPMMENSDNIDEEVIKGKVVFSTFHTSKGRQRPYVFVVGFDHSYFTINARTMDPTKCPNTLYVATTRASKQLYLLETSGFNSDRPLKFLKQSHMEMKTKPYIDFRGIPQSIFEDKQISKNEITINRTTPTKMVKFISESVLEEITPVLDEIFISIIPKQSEILLPTIVRTKSGFYEDVSDLNGIAIPALLYDYIRSLYTEDFDTCVLYDMIQETISQIKPDKHPYLRTIVSQLNPICNSVEDYLYMSNVYQASEEKLYFKLKQIQRDEYDWLSTEVLKKCKKRLLDVLETEITSGGQEPEMEKTIIDCMNETANQKINEFLSAHFPPTQQFQFTARVDLITKDTLWELKCTSEISAEHMIQTVIYAWLAITIDPMFSKKVKIFNIRSGEVLELIAEKAALNKIVLALLKGKYGQQHLLTDEEFLKECHEYLHR